jgi:hypothetical protein
VGQGGPHRGLEEAAQRSEAGGGDGWLRREELGGVALGGMEEG